jgi:hypothetical protein
MSEPIPGPDAPTDEPVNRRRRRLVVALTAVVVVLVAAAGVLAVLLVEQRSTARELAAADAAEDREHREQMAGFEQERDELDQRYAAADEALTEAEQRIDDAEAVQRQAEDEAVARQEIEAERAADDAQTFVDAMRSVDVMPGVADAELLARGEAVCTYLDSTAGSPADVTDAFDRAAETYGLEDSVLLVTAATGILCPEYGG